VVDGPTEESERVHRYIHDVIGQYKVYETSDKGKVVFHPSRLTEAVIYGLHACNLGGAPAVWDGRQYVFGTEALAYVVEVACPSASDSANKSAVKKILARLKLERDFDLPAPGLIRYENCVYDCETGKATPLDKTSWQSRIPNPIPHPLHLDAPAVGVVDKFLDDLADGHEDIRRNILQVVFLCMARYVHHEQVAVLIGQGANGKSKLVDVLLRVVGMDNASFLSLDRMANRFEVGDLSGSLVNLSNDISSEYLSGDKTSIWKQVSGGDVVKADVKNLPGYAFKPYTFLVIVGNALPRMEGGIDKAVSRRLHVIPFTHSFRDANGRYSEDADPHIVEKICEPASMAYLIRLAIEEGRRMLAQREFRLTPNYASEAEVHKLALDNSSVLSWADYVALTEKDLHMQRGQTVYERYSNWCKRAQLKAVSSSRFNDEITTQYAGVECVTTRAERYVAAASGLMAKERTAQYGAFAIAEQYEAERASHVTYCEVVGTRQTMTSVSVSDSGDRRENHKVEQVALGVRPATALPTPDHAGRLFVPDAWWEEHARYEE